MSPTTTSPTCPTCKGEMYFEKPIYFCLAGSDGECTDANEYQICDACEQLIERDCMRGELCVDCLSCWNREPLVNGLPMPRYTP